MTCQRSYCIIRETSSILTGEDGSRAMRVRNDFEPVKLPTCCSPDTSLAVGEEWLPVVDVLMWIGEADDDTNNDQIGTLQDCRKRRLVQ